MYTIHYTNIPVSYHKYKITVEENVFNNEVERYLVYDKEERDSILEALKNTYKEHILAEHIY